MHLWDSNSHTILLLYSWIWMQCLDFLYHDNMIYSSVNLSVSWNNAMFLYQISCMFCTTVCAYSIGPPSSSALEPKHTACSWWSPSSPRLDVKSQVPQAFLQAIVVDQEFTLTTSHLGAAAMRNNLTEY